MVNSPQRKSPIASSLSEDIGGSFLPGMWPRSTFSTRSLNMPVIQLKGTGCKPMSSVQYACQAAQLRMKDRHRSAVRTVDKTIATEVLQYSLLWIQQFYHEQGSATRIIHTHNNNLDYEEDCWPLGPWSLSFFSLCALS